MFNWVMNVPLNLSCEFCCNLFLFFLQKCETAGCRILCLLKVGDERAYLLHGNNGRYAQDAIPGTKVYTNVLEIKTPPNCTKINATECFPGKILAPAEQAKNYLRSKGGISCNRAGAYIPLYNFRIFVANNENVGDSIMKAIVNTYEPIFM